MKYSILIVTSLICMNGYVYADACPSNVLNTCIASCENQKSTMNTCDFTASTTPPGTTSPPSEATSTGSKGTFSSSGTHTTSNGTVNASGARTVTNGNDTLSGTYTATNGSSHHEVTATDTPTGTTATGSWDCTCK